MISSLSSVTRLTQHFGRSLGGDQNPSRAAHQADADLSASSAATSALRTPLDTASARHGDSGTASVETRSRPTLPDHVPPLGQLDEIHFEHNRSVTFRRIDHLAAVLRQADPAMALRITQVASELKLRFENGRHAASAAELLPAFLPDNTLDFAYGDYDAEDDHAALVEHIANATGRTWNPENVSSNYDADIDKWIVRFQEESFWRQWRFTQDAGWLNENFTQQVIQRAETRSGRRMTFFDVTERAFGISLPFGLHQRLVNDELLVPRRFEARPAENRPEPAMPSSVDYPVGTTPPPDLARAA